MKVLLSRIINIQIKKTENVWKIEKKVKITELAYMELLITFYDTFQLTSFSLLLDCFEPKSNRPVLLGMIPIVTKKKTAPAQTTNRSKSSHLIRFTSKYLHEYKAIQHT